MKRSVLLSKLKSSKKIEVDLDISELDLAKAEAKATYAEIKQYVLDKFGMKVCGKNIKWISE